MTTYAFCESVSRASDSHWHLRVLTEVGLKRWGGIDTPSLCFAVTRGWDLETTVTYDTLRRLEEDGYLCPACFAAYVVGTP